MRFFWVAVFCGLMQTYECVSRLAPRHAYSEAPSEDGSPRLPQRRSLRGPLRAGTATSSRLVRGAILQGLPYSEVLSSKDRGTLFRGLLYSEALSSEDRHSPGNMQSDRDFAQVFAQDKVYTWDPRKPLGRVPRGGPKL